MTKMRLAGEKAIQLDPLSADANVALGILHAREAQRELSEKSSRRALELDPNQSLTRELLPCTCCFLSAGSRRPSSRIV
jgi:Tfp pilus assembly protein PilF